MLGVYSGLAPEIVHFRIPSDGLDGSAMPSDWYIKGAKCVFPAQTPYLDVYLSFIGPVPQHHTTLVTFSGLYAAASRQRQR